MVRLRIGYYMYLNILLNGKTCRQVNQCMISIGYLVLPSVRVDGGWGLNLL